jgi:hypothetical protein
MNLRHAVCNVDADIALVRGLKPETNAEGAKF